METKHQWFFKSCRPTELVSNVIIIGDIIKEMEDFVYL
jgi:hypothetical protein